MDDAFVLSERAKRWIKALRSHYKADMLDMSLLSEQDLLELEEGFKML
jgi:hypothetical protein